MAAPRLCSFPQCAKPHYGRGLCKMHYERQRLRGDPAIRFSGGPHRFISDVVLGHASEDCLLWPHATNDRGYPQIRIDGVTKLVTPIICELVHGPRPTANHEVAHSCGRGDSGCVAPQHLRWATKAQNEADKLKHGTSNRGSRHGMSRLTEADVRRVRELGLTLTQTDIAQRYNVSVGCIGAILRGTNWGWLR